MNLDELLEAHAEHLGADVGIARVRPTPTGDELDAMYAEPNNAGAWAEHRFRLDITRVVAKHVLADDVTGPGIGPVVLDPAAGTSNLAWSLAGRHGVSYTGDLAPTATVNYPGWDAVRFLNRYRSKNEARADLVLLGEILEHVDDPVALLDAARGAARRLVLSTPLDEPAGVNPEHVWRWNRAGIEYLLGYTGWQPTRYVEVSLDVPDWGRYRCQIHAAEAMQ